MGHAGYGMWSWHVVWLGECGEVRSQTLARLGAGKRMEKFEDYQTVKHMLRTLSRGKIAR